MYNRHKLVFAALLISRIQGHHTCSVPSITRKSLSDRRCQEEEAEAETLHNIDITLHVNPLSLPGSGKMWRGILRVFMCLLMFTLTASYPVFEVPAAILQ